MLDKETIASGASPTCQTCEITPPLNVYESPAGFYVGTFCACGPYSRESGYYASHEEAYKAMMTGTYSR